MSIRSTAALIIAVAVVGGGLWVAALVGMAQFTEDLCFDDLDSRPAYGGYRSDSALWPPSYECQLIGNDVEPLVVQHRGVALARLVATVALPVVYTTAATLGIVFWRRRRSPVSSRATTPPAP